MFPVTGLRDYGGVLIVQPDGRLLIAGQCDNGTNIDFCAARLNSNGTFDAAFGGFAGAGPGKFRLAISGADDAISAAALQPDGKLLLAGTCGGVGSEDFCLARLHADGSLDGSYDGPSGSGNGVLFFPMAGASDRAYALALQTDGKAVVAGACNNGVDFDFCVARLHGGPFAYQNCKPDIDGDGRFLATTDALINMRIALGLTGTAVVNGVTFPANATRTTWPLIRDYLVNQCGLRLTP